MINDGMKLVGLNKVLANMNLMVGKLSGDFKRIAKKAGMIIEKRAKENIRGQHGHDRHWITGTLARSIKTGEPYYKGANIIEVPIGTDVFYAVSVEYRDRTGGFLRPALFESEKAAMMYMQATIAGEIVTF